VGVDDAVRQRDNESLLEINGSSVIPTGRLWAFGNFSRFVLPGAVRIAATTTDGRLTLDAFKNTSGAVTVVVLNTSKRTDPVTVSLSGTGVSDGATVTPYLTNSSNNIAAQATTSVSGGAFSYTMPARSLVTFQI
jgi:O-glycosyl hydrolase